MRNLERVQRVAELLREAERLLQQEVVAQHHDRMLARLAVTVWVCRDGAEEALEVALDGGKVRVGRPERESHG